MSTMIYDNLSEIYETKKLSLRKLEESVRALTPAQAVFKPSAGGWSIAEVVEHMSIVDGQIMHLVTTLLKKTEEAGRTTIASSFPISLQAIFERSRTEKYVTREASSPTGKKTVMESVRLLRDLQTQFESLRPRVQVVDLSFVAFPHAIFGSLTLGQWLAFMSLHEERHIGQITSTLASPGFPQVRQ